MSNLFFKMDSSVCGNIRDLRSVFIELYIKATTPFRGWCRYALVDRYAIDPSISARAEVGLFLFPANCLEARQLLFQVLPGKQQTP